MNQQRKWWSIVALGAALLLPLSASALIPYTTYLSVPGNNSWNGNTISLMCNVSPQTGETVDKAPLATGVEFWVDVHGNGVSWVKIGTDTDGSLYGLQYNSVTGVDGLGLEAVGPNAINAAVYFKAVVYYHKASDPGTQYTFTATGKAATLAGAAIPYSLKIDNTKPVDPTITYPAGPLSGSTLPITIHPDATDTGSGVHGYNIVISKTAPGAYTYGSANTKRAQPDYWAWSATGADITANVVLPTGAGVDGTYYIYINTSDKNASGWNWSHSGTPGVTPYSFVLDNTKPVLTPNVPLNLAVGVAVDSSVTFTANEAVTANVGSITIKDTATSGLTYTVTIPVASVGIVGGTALTIPHSAIGNFPSSTQLTVNVVDSAFKDAVNLGNISTSWSFTTAADPCDTPPTAICVASPYPLSLDATGNATLLPADLDNGSHLAPGCAGTPTLALSKTTFDCTNLGDNTVTLSVTDAKNVTTTCDVTVHVSAPAVGAYEIAFTQSCMLDATIAVTGGVTGQPYELYFTDAFGGTYPPLAATIPGTLENPANITGIDLSASGLNFTDIITAHLSLLDACDNPSGSATDTTTIDATAPSITNLALDNSCYNAADVTAKNVGFTFNLDNDSATTYTWTITDGAIDVIGSGSTTTTGTSSVTVSTIDISTLADGDLTLTVEVTDACGNSTSTSTVPGDSTKDTVVPPGTVAFANSCYNAAEAPYADITFSDAEAGTSYSVTVVDTALPPNTYSLSGGPLAAGTNTVTLDLSSLVDGLLTLSVTISDACGNDTVLTDTDTATKDIVPPGGTVAFDDVCINAAAASAATFTFSGAAAGDTYTWQIVDEGAAHSATGTGTLAAANDQVTADLSALNDGTVTLTVTITDACDNTSILDPVTATLDTSAPDFTAGPPASDTFECDNVPAGSVNDVTVSDGSVVYSEVPTPGDCISSYSLLRTWTVTDACGNSNVATQTLAVEDTQAPAVTGTLDQINAGCPQDPALVPMTTITALTDAGLTITDCALDDAAVQHGDEQISNNPITITRTYYVRDLCDHQTDVTQTIVINDTEAPVIACPNEVTVSCEGPEGAIVTELTHKVVNDVQVSTLATAMDNCTDPADIEITYEWPGSNGQIPVEELSVAGYPFSIGVTTITVTAKDDVNNTSTCEFSVRVQAGSTTVVVLPSADDPVIAPQAPLVGGAQQPQRFLGGNPSYRMDQWVPVVIQLHNCQPLAQLTIALDYDDDRLEAVMPDEYSPYFATLDPTEFQNSFVAAAALESGRVIAPPEVRTTSHTHDAYARVYFTFRNPGGGEAVGIDGASSDLLTIYLRVRAYQDYLPGDTAWIDAWAVEAVPTTGVAYEDVRIGHDDQNQGAWRYIQENDAQVTLDDCWQYFDVDWDGTVNYATDGVYIYRALLGLELYGTWDDMDPDFFPIVDPVRRSLYGTWSELYADRQWQHKLGSFLPQDWEIVDFVDYLAHGSHGTVNVDGTLRRIMDVDLDGRVTNWRDGVYIYRWLANDQNPNARPFPEGTVPVAHMLAAPPINAGAALDRNIEVLSAAGECSNDPDNGSWLNMSDDGLGRLGRDWDAIAEGPYFTSNWQVYVAQGATAVETLTAVGGLQPLTFSIIGGPDVALFSLNGADLAFIEAPAAERWYQVTVQVQDADGRTDWEWINVFVVAPPVFTNPAVNPATYQWTSGDFRPNQWDPTSTTYVDLMLANSSRIDRFEISVDPAGVFYCGAGGDLWFFGSNPPAPGVYTVTITVWDGVGQFATQDITVTIDAANTAPIIDGGDNVNYGSQGIGGELIHTVTTTDPDVPPQTLTYSILDGADKTLFTINADTGDLSFTLDVADVSSYNGAYDFEVIVEVTDGIATDSQTIIVNVAY